MARSNFKVFIRMAATDLVDSSSYLNLIQFGNPQSKPGDVDKVSEAAVCFSAQFKIARLMGWASDINFVDLDQLTIPPDKKRMKEFLFLSPNAQLITVHNTVHQRVQSLNNDINNLANRLNCSPNANFGTIISRLQEAPISTQWGEKLKVLLLKYAKSYEPPSKGDLFAVVKESANYADRVLKTSCVIYEAQKWCIERDVKYPIQGAAGLDFRIEMRDLLLELMFTQYALNNAWNINSLRSLFKKTRFIYKGSYFSQVILDSFRSASIINIESLKL